VASVQLGQSTRFPAAFTYAYTKLNFTLRNKYVKVLKFFLYVG